LAFCVVNPWLFSFFAGELFAVGAIAAFILAVGIVAKPRTFTVAHLQ
jgi:hypothetical protein